MAEPIRKNQTPQSASNDSNSNKNSNNAHSALEGRQSKELVIALCGPIGCGIASVKEQLHKALEDDQYEIFDIRVSQLIEDFCRETECRSISYSHSPSATRYIALMDAGNFLRKQFGTTICADLSIRQISMLRQPPKNAKNSDINDDKNIALRKRAYIIDQLKHPDEVKALKSVYGNLFYLVGVLSDWDRRETSLEQKEGLSKADAHNLIQRDRAEDQKNGQQLEATLYHADFFINNSNPNSSSTKALFIKFMKLIHGGHGVTPTQEEYGMYAAYSASVQSACMSRQVGAAILDKNGNLLSIGKNDVPKFGGGLYSEDDNYSPSTRDFRCVHKDQQCHNDLHKNKLKNRIEEILSSEIQALGSENTELQKALKDIDISSLAQNIVKNSQIKSLIEYSRAIHAEMDSILSLVRSGKSIPAGSTIYTTTFPCHNCARHIVAAGLESVVYIEPYEKSLALTLHDDSITKGTDQNKVQLRPFQGVSPKRYQTFFSNTSPKKDDKGKMIITDRESQQHIDKQYVDSYIERELKVANCVLERTSSTKTQTS